MNLKQLIILLKTEYRCIDDINSIEEIKTWVKPRISIYPELLTLNVTQKLLESEKFDVVAMIQSLAQLLRSRSIRAVPMIKYDFCNALIRYLDESFTSTSSRTPVHNSGLGTLILTSPAATALNLALGYANIDYQKNPLESFLESNITIGLSLLKDGMRFKIKEFLDKNSFSKEVQLYILKLFLEQNEREDSEKLVQFIEKFFVSNDRGLLSKPGNVFKFQECQAWFKKSYKKSYALSMAIGYLPDSQDVSKILYVLHHLCKFFSQSKFQDYGDLRELKTLLEEKKFYEFFRKFEQKTELKILTDEIQHDSDITVLFQELYDIINITVYDLDSRHAAQYLHTIESKVPDHIYSKLKAQFKQYLQGRLHSGAMEKQKFVYDGIVSSLSGELADMLLASELGKQMSYYPLTPAIRSISIGHVDQELATAKYDVIAEAPRGIPLTLFLQFFSNSTYIVESAIQANIMRGLFPGLKKYQLCVYWAPDKQYRLYFKRVSSPLDMEKDMPDILDKYKPGIYLDYNPKLDIDLALLGLAAQLPRKTTINEEGKEVLRKKMGPYAISTSLPVDEKFKINHTLRVKLTTHGGIWDGSPYGTMSHLLDTNFSCLNARQAYQILNILREIENVCHVISPDMLPYLLSNLYLSATRQNINIFFDTDAQLIQVSYDPSEVNARFNILNRNAEKVLLSFGNIEGWDFFNVEGDGNCFYHAVVNQLQKLDIKKELLEKPETHLLLRKQTQREQYKDGEWVGENDIISFTTVFQDISIAIMDVGIPEQGYTVLFFKGHKCTREDIPQDIHILRLAFTGNHYMSVLTNPSLTQGYLQESYDIEDFNNQPMLCGTHYSNKGVKKNEAMILASFFNITWINDLPPAERGLGRVIIDSDVPGSQSYSSDIHVIYQGIQCKTPSCVDNAFFTARKAQSLGYKVCLLEQDVHLVTLISYPESMTLQDVLIKIDAVEIAEDTSMWEKYLEWTGINHSTNRDISIKYSPSILGNIYDEKLLAQHKYYLETGEIFSTLANSSLMLPELDSINYVIEQYMLNDILQQFYSTAEHNNFLVDALADMANLTNVEEQIAVLSQFILPYVIDGNYEGDYVQLTQILLSHYNLEPQHNMLHDSSNTTQLVLGGENIILEGSISYTLDL